MIVLLEIPSLMNSILVLKMGLHLCLMFVKKNAEIEDTFIRMDVTTVIGTTGMAVIDNVTLSPVGFV